MCKMFSIEVIKSWYEEFAKDKVEDALLNVECFVDNIVRPIRRFPKIIKANIEMLYAFNKGGWYNDWDYDFLYEMIIWKLDRIRSCIRDNDIIVEADKVYNEITEALEQWKIYKDPESVMTKPKWMEERLEEAMRKGNYEGVLNPDLTEEQLNEEKEYYTNFYKTEQKAWNKFHDLLKKHAQGWWD